MANKTYKIMFFPNGQTAVFKDGQMIKDLSMSWFKVFAMMLESLGVVLQEAEFVMPDANKTTVLVAEDGRLKWQIEKDDDVETYTD